MHHKKTTTILNPNPKVFLKNYLEGVDFKFLEAMGITWIFYQPWQLGLFNEELEGKFLWYPKKGTLMFSHQEKGINTKIKNTGDFKGTYAITEEVYRIIINKINEQEEAAFIKCSRCGEKVHEDLLNINRECDTCKNDR